MKKRLFPLLLALACLLTVPAYAAEVQTVHVSMRGVPWIYVENKEAGFLDSLGGRREALLYNGTVYIPLRTAGAWMGADVDWDQETMTVALTSGKAAPLYFDVFDFNDMNVERLEGVEQYQADMVNGVDVQLRPDITIKVDGQVRQFVNVLGQSVYPLLFRECVYLPVRNIGELCGKRVLWFPYQFSGSAQPSSRVHIYNAPTAEQLAEANAYFSAVKGHIEELRALAQGWLVETEVTEEQITQRVMALQKPLQDILDLPTPAFLGAGKYAETVQVLAKAVLNESLVPYQDPEFRASNSYYLALSLPQRRDYIVRFLLEKESNTYFTQLESVCNHGGAFLAQVAALEDQ